MTPPMQVDYHDLLRLGREADDQQHEERHDQT